MAAEVAVEVNPDRLISGSRLSIFSSSLDQFASDNRRFSMSDRCNSVKTVSESRRFVCLIRIYEHVCSWAIHFVQFRDQLAFQAVRYRFDKRLLAFVILELGHSRVRCVFITSATLIASADDNTVSRPSSPSVPSPPPPLPAKLTGLYDCA